jgi:group I intron endonuclease
MSDGDYTGLGNSDASYLEVTHRLGRALPDTPAVYLIKSPSGKGYVGQALNLRLRMQSHRSPCRIKGTMGKSPALYRAVAKYGWARMRVFVLATPKAEDLDSEEQRFVQLLGTLSPGGYNLTTGGDAGRSDAPEVKEKKRCNTVASWHNPKVRARRIANMGKGIAAGWAKLSAEEWEARTAANRDHLRSEAGKQHRARVHGAAPVAAKKRSAWAERRKSTIMAMPEAKRGKAWRDSYGHALLRAQRMGPEHVARVEAAYAEEKQGWASAYLKSGELALLNCEGEAGEQ